MAHETKMQKVYDHLKVTSLTSWQAIQLYKATRLASYVHRLRKRGCIIDSETIRKDDGTTYSEYTLVKDVETMI